MKKILLGLTLLLTGCVTYHDTPLKIKQNTVFLGEVDDTVTVINTDKGVFRVNGYHIYFRPKWRKYDVPEWLPYYKDEIVNVNGSISPVVYYKKLKDDK